jgi:exodeoxyribonuclease VIII
MTTRLLVPEMDIDVYHRHPALSKSGLDNINQSIAHYLYARKTQPDTQALKIGRALHTLVLEGEDAFRDGFAYPGKGSTEDNWSTKAGKAWRDEQYAEGRIPLHYAQAEELTLMLRSLKEHEQAYTWLKQPGMREHSFFWTDVETGIECRCRPDLLAEVEGMRVLVDLKTTRDARPQQFLKSVVNYRYHVQDAWYSDGIAAVLGEAPVTFMLVAIESSPPYAVAMYELDHEWLERGRVRYREDLERWAEYQETQNKWVGYPAEIELLTMPRWA